MNSNNLTTRLAQIGLRSLPEQLDDFLARAAKDRWSPHQILERMVEEEVAERARRRAAEPYSSSSLSNWLV